SSGKSVSTSRTTCPRSPCGRAMRPTTAIVPQSRSGPPVANLQRDWPALLLGGEGGQRPQRGGRAPLPPDDAPQLAGRDEQLDEGRALVAGLDHPHFIRMIGQRPGQDLDDVAGDAHWAASGAAAAGGAAFGVRCRAIKVRTESD